MTSAGGSSHHERTGAPSRRTRWTGWPLPAGIAALAVTAPLLVLLPAGPLQAGLAGMAAALGVTLLLLLYRRRATPASPQELLAEVVHGLPQYISLKDRDGRYLLMNSSLAAALGVEPEHATGRTIEELLPGAEDYQPLLRMERTALATGHAQEDPRLEVEDREGTRRTFSAVRIPLQAAGSDEPLLLSVTTEITAQVAAEDAVADSERRYRQLAETTTDILLTFDRAGRITYLNAAGSRWLGYSPVEARALHIQSLFPDSERRLLAELTGSFPEGETGAGLFETSLLDREGRLTPVELRSTPLRDEEGSVHEVMLVARDVRDRLDAERALLVSEERYHFLIESISDILLVVDRDWKVVLVNEAGLRLARAPRGQQVGMPLDQFIPGFTDSRFFETFDRVMRLRQPEQIVAEFTRPDGQVGWYEARVYPASAGILTLITDATQRKQAELALRASQRRLSAIFENAATGIAVVNRNFRLSQVNSTWSGLFGYGEKEALGRHVRELIHPSSLPAATRRVRQLLARPATSHRLEALFLRRDGSTFWGDLAFSPVYDEYDKLTAIAGLVVDVTEQRNSERRFRSIFEQSSEMMAVLQDGRVRLTNPRFGEVMGYGADEVTAEDFSPTRFLPPHDRPEALQRLRRIEEEGLPRPIQAEVKLLARDGEVVETDVNISRMDWDGRPALLVLMRDVRERNRLRARLQQAQRLESIGRVSGGIAHDFNNFLTVILGHATFAKRKVEQDSPLRPEIEGILKTSKRATEMVKQLLAFGRQQVFSARNVDLNEQLRDARDLLKHALGEEHQLRLDLAEGVLPIRIDPTQLQQMLMNVTVNARDAMPQGGTLTLATRALAPDEYPLLSGEDDNPPAGWVRLVASDTGEGIRKDMQEKIFEPFFTTKSVGKGTGLGLSMVYGIVRQSGGQVSLESQQGKGTSFVFDLPAAQGEVEPPMEEEEVAEPTAVSANILVVDDEDEIRNMALRTLTEAGHMVYATASSEEAVQLADKVRTRMDLMITDIVMPGLRGPELVQQLAARWPDAEILYISGFSDAAQDALAESDHANFLAKPFTPDSLEQKVSGVLGRRASSGAGEGSAPPASKPAP